MDEDEAAKIKSHLIEWQRQHRLNSNAAVDVQRLLERADWMVDASAAIRSDAPNEIARPLASGLARDRWAIVKQYPIPYGRAQNIQLSTATSTASSEMYAVSVLSDLDEQSAGKFKLLLRRYNSIIDEQDRFGETCARFNSLFPDLLEYLRSAEAAYRRAHSFDEIANAALSMRTLVDKLKGELFERARSLPEEQKIAWQTIAERLVVPPRSDEQRRMFLEQESQRASLYGALSELAKQRAAPTIDKLHAAWAQTLDHCFIICGCLSEENRTQ